MAQENDKKGFIIENCENVFPFYLSSDPSRQRRTCFYDDKGNTKGVLSVSRDAFVNLDDNDGGKIEGILIHVPRNGFQYVVTKECPVMRSSKYTWLFPNAEPETANEGKNDETGKNESQDYHCFGITFPSDIDDKTLDAFDKCLSDFCQDYRQADCEVLPKEALGSDVDGNSSIKELVAAATTLSQTLLNKTTSTINAELEKRPEWKAKYEKSKEYANKAKTKIKEKFKESKLKEKFFKAKARLSKETNELTDDLKKGDTKNVEDKFDRGTASTVQFIRLVSKSGQNTIQSIKTVLIQRMPEYDMKENDDAKGNEQSDSQQPTKTGAADNDSKEAAAPAAAASGDKKVDPKVMQGLDKAKQSTAFVGQVGASVVKAVAIGAGHTVKSIGKQVEKNETLQKHINDNPITYGNLKVIGKKTLHSYVTIANELENAALFLFSEAAHAGADIAEHKHGKEVGKAAHDTADVAVNIVNIFRLDNELIYGTIQEATRDENADAAANANANANANGNAVNGGSDAAVQAAVGQAVMASMIASNMQNNKYQQ